MNTSALLDGVEAEIETISSKVAMLDGLLIFTSISASFIGSLYFEKRLPFHSKTEIFPFDKASLNSSISSGTLSLLRLVNSRSIISRSLGGM